MRDEEGQASRGMLSMGRAAVRGGDSAADPARRRPRRARTVAALAAGTLVLSLGACEALPSLPGSGSAAPSSGDPSAAPAMDPDAVAAAESVPVDPSWLCRPGEGEPLAPSTEGGTFTPEAVHTEGGDIQVSGSFRLAPDHDYRGFAPEGVLLPADPENRGVPAPGFDGELGVEGAPVPPIVVRGRVEVPGEGPAPQAATARLTLGTCDDAPLPDGQFLLRLRGGVDGPGRGEEDAGWGASGDVLVDVVDGRPEAVPGAVTAPSGEIPAELSPLGCRAELAPVGDGDGLTVTVEDPSVQVPTAVPDGEDGAAVSGTVTVTSQDHGSRALLQGIVLTDPATGTVVAGARNTPEIPLQWIGAEGVTRTERAWTSHGACGADALAPGQYEARAVAVTVDAEGATHLVLSDPWGVEVVEDDAVQEQAGQDEHAS